MRHFVFLILLTATAFDLNGQAKTRKLSSSINHPSINLYAPFVSSEGNALIFISDNAEDGVLTPFYSIRESTDWRTPQELPKNIHTRLSFLWGYSLSSDASKLYFSTTKAPSVGGFDVFATEMKGNSWTEPLNLGAPINSKLHEGCAAFTPDGSTIYFMRCEKMDQQKAENCKIFTSTKKANGQWEEPVELPAWINAGNSQTPRIMADGETLIFSSDKILPNKGGMDLYETKYLSGSWSKPIALDFVNSEKNDQYVSAAALGRYLMKDVQGPRKNELVEFLFPEDLRPKGMMKVEGKVTGTGSARVSAYVSAVKLQTGERVFSGRPAADGSFMLYLKEGGQYLLAIDPEQNNYSYFVKTFDLTGDKFPQAEKLSAQLKQVTPGDEIGLSVTFKENTPELNKHSTYELEKLARMMKANPQLTFDFNVTLVGYKEDSLQSDPDLTEIRYDSVLYQYDDIDSLGQLFTEDSIAIEAVYHNDRTVKQAESIINELTALGVKSDDLTYSVSISPAVIPEERKTLVKLIVK